MTEENELIMYMKKIEEFDKDSAQDGTALYSYLIELTNVMARCNTLMAIYKRENRQEKKAAYLKMIASSQSSERYFAPSLAKDFIESQCSETGYLFDLSERCSRLCNHTMSAIITIISSLKSERQFAQYQ